MDAFYASVEQRDDRQLHGRSVIVAWRGKRSVFCAAPYEARVFGDEIFKRHMDIVEPLSLDEAYLDVTENKTSPNRGSRGPHHTSANPGGIEPCDFRDRGFQQVPG